VYALQIPTTLLIVFGPIPLPQEALAETVLEEVT
jgi:hypothetical protein